MLNVIIVFNKIVSHMHDYAILVDVILYSWYVKTKTKITYIYEVFFFIFISSVFCFFWEFFSDR